MTSVATAMELHLPAREVARILGVEERTLANWRLRRQGPPWVKFGASVRYPANALREWIDAQPAGGCEQ